MPDVEIVEWNGKHWRRYPGSRNRTDRVYYKRGNKFLHREVWILANGPIPKGHHIHHADENPGNNDLGNLRCVSPKQHSAEFHRWSDERIAKSRDHLASIRHLTKPWHASAEGLAKHREVGALAYRNFKPEAKHCEQCRQEFLPKKIGNTDRFCGNACKSAWRRSAGLDDVERTCPECGKQFMRNKYSRAAACSRSCGNRHRGRTIKARVRPDSGKSP